jgi:hypothetical protein
MKTHLGDMWNSFKKHLSDVWEKTKQIMKSERGSMGDLGSYEEFRAKMEKRQQGENGSAMTEMEMARIEEILIGHEAAERFLAASRRQGLRGR